MFVLRSVEKLEQLFKDSEIDSDKKVSLLLTLIGSEANRVLKDLLAPTLPSQTSYEELVDKLRKHYNAKNFTVAERYKFHSASQEHHEDVKSFAARLKQLAKYCGFGDTLDISLRDKLVCGLKSENIRKRLSAENGLDFEQAYTIAIGMESVENRLKVMSFEDDKAYAVSQSFFNNMECKRKFHKLEKEVPGAIPCAKIRKVEVHERVETQYLPRNSFQIEATKKRVKKGISKRTKLRRDEIDANNIREFCHRDGTLEFSCARLDAVFRRREDSKSHLLVDQVLNTYQYRDQNDSNYLTKFIPSNGFEERFQNLEFQLGLNGPMPKDLYQRLAAIEDRLLYLEGTTTECIQFYDEVMLLNKPPSENEPVSYEMIRDTIERSA